MRYFFQPFLRTIGAAAAVMFFLPVARAAVVTIAAAPTPAGYRVTIDLNTENVAVNAVAAHLLFDPKLFVVNAVNTGGSIIDLWIQSPGFSNTSGTIDFSGIIPGGMTTADGTLATLTILPRATGTFPGFASTSFEVLLNDGKGTPASVSIMAQPFVFSALLPPSSSSPASPAADLEPPNPFLPQIARDQELFGGKYFLVFAATDQQSGIASYQILEVPTGGGTTPQWQMATSPYLLRDQTLSSNIYVRAVDAAGNFRTVEIPALHPGRASGEGFPALAERIGILAALCVLGWFIWWMRKKRAKKVIL